MAAVTEALMGVLKRLRAYRVLDWGPDSAEMAPAEDREVVEKLEKAHVVSSLLDPQPETPDLNDLHTLFLDVPPRVEGEGERHMVLLDLDVPAHLVPSSTYGHSHLYIDVPGGVPADVYWELVRALAKAGVIEPGYAGVSEERGYTALRLPWIHKLMAAEDGKSIEELEELHTTFAPNVEPKPDPGPIPPPF